MFDALKAKVALYAAGLALIAALGLGGYAMVLRAQNEALSVRVTDAEASRAAQADVASVLGGALVQTRVRASEYSQLYEEIANVQDDGSCRSPSIDRSLDLLRARRGEN